MTLKAPEITPEPILKVWRNVSRRLATRSLRLRPVPIVAVTGSVGKSTTTAFIAEMLATQMKVETTKNNWNVGWALAATLLGANYTRSLVPLLRQLPTMFWRGLVRPKPCDVFVLEVATNYPGEIPASLTVFRPCIAVYTTITNAHLGNFPSAAALLAEKAALIEALPPDGVAVLRYDDDCVRGLATRHRGETIFYGFDERAAVRMTEPWLDDAGQHVDLIDPEGTVSLTLPFIQQRHHLYAVMAAWCVGRLMQIPRAVMIDAAQRFSPLAGRGEMLQGIHGTLVIDDSHNASPAATVAAIDSLVAIRDGRRKLVVLGDMKELGDETEAGHREVGLHAAAKADVLIAVGECRDILASAFRQNGGGEVFTFRNVGECLAAIDGWLKPRDAVLVKGSHSVNLGRVVRELAPRRDVKH